MATNTSKENSTRKQMGFIKFPNRSYPVYEGLNVVGRDPKATVRVKDLIFSKQHAVITIINENMHFVSDFGSSNGTQVQDITCIPYKMYAINDWDTIIVGSIVGIYHTGTDENLDIHDNATQFNDTIPPTQLLTDKETEQLPNTQAIHDAETQLKPLISTIEDLEFSKSEIYDDICANETFRQQLTGKKYIVEVDETLPTNPKPTTDTSLDSDDIILSTQDNEMIDKQTSEILKTQPVKHDNPNSSSNIKNNIEIITKMQETININNTDNNSDSDTDVDDELLVKNQSINKIDDDSATDIEDEESFVKKIQQQSTQFNTSNADNDADDDLLIKSKPDDHSDDEELDLMGPTEKIIDSQNDDDLFLVPTQLLTDKHPQNPEPPSHNIHEAPTQKIDTNIHEAPTQLIEQNIHDVSIQPPEHKKDEPTLETAKDDLGVQEDDDDDQTQDLLKGDDTLQQKCDEYIRKQPDTDDDTPTQILEKEEKIIEDDDFLAPTQLLQDQNKQNDDTSDDLPPTQLLTTAEVHHKDDDDEFLAPTQLLEDKITKIQDKEPTDDDFLAPTQALHEAPTILIENNDSAFLAATQPIKSILNSEFPKRKKTVNFSEDVIFDAPTQNIPDIHDQPTIELHKDNSDIYDMPTQQILDNKNPEKEQNSESSNSERTNKDLSLTQDSNISLKLVLSDDSIVEKPKQDAETQLEVNFDLETQKLYLEDKTRRPDNPLANMFAEEPTQNTEDIIDEQQKRLTYCKRLEIRLQNIKDIEDASVSTPKTTAKKGRPKKSIDKVAESAPKLNITKVKSDVKKAEETPVEEKRSTRGKRISYLKLNNGEIDLKPTQKKIQNKDIDENDDDFEPDKNIVRSPRKQLKTLKVTLDKIEDKTAVETPQRSSRRLTKTPAKIEVTDDDNSNDFKFNKRKQSIQETPINKDNESTSRSSSRLTKTSSTETEEEVPKNKRTLVEKKKENLMEEKRSSRRQKTPAKRVVNITETPKKEEITIEDSSDSENFPVKKKLLKLEYTQDNSNSSDAFKAKTRRVTKIEESSSDETDNVSLHSNTKRRKYEPLNVTVTSSQETVLHKVVFTMLNDTELENYVKKLGGSVIDSAQNCTILVTNKISRSLKFLVAIASGKPIVNANWIRDSMKKNQFLDPWDYLLVDKESETKFKFNLEKSLKKSLEKKLLTDISILIAAKKNFEVLKEIIETSGGKIITRAPGKNSTAYVVSYEEERSKYSKYLKQKNLTVVSAEAIFSGVLQQELHWEDHLLT